MGAKAGCHLWTAITVFGAITDEVSHRESDSWVVTRSRTPGAQCSADSPRHTRATMPQLRPRPRPSLYLRHPRAGAVRRAPRSTHAFAAAAADETANFDAQPSGLAHLLSDRRPHDRGQRRRQNPADLAHRPLAVGVRAGADGLLRRERRVLGSVRLPPAVGLPVRHVGREPRAAPAEHGVHRPAAPLRRGRYDRAAPPPTPPFLSCCSRARRVAAVGAAGAGARERAAYRHGEPRADPQNRRNR